MEGHFRSGIEIYCSKNAPKIYEGDPNEIVKKNASPIVAQILWESNQCLI